MAPVIPAGFDVDGFVRLQAAFDAGDPADALPLWRELHALRPGDEAVLLKLGEMPLPPYISQRLGDVNRYQTVYARDPKSAAAPTAGLHFTPELLAAVRAQGVPVVSVELVVGLDTFAPITVDNPLEHVIHSESYHVPAETQHAVSSAKRVVVIGTTATRALESFGATGQASGRTNLFITRGF